jgi:hypothetical protein
MHAPSPRKPTLDADQRRALRLLAAAANGYPEALFLAHGFTANLVEALIAAGLVTTNTRRHRFLDKAGYAQRSCRRKRSKTFHAAPAGTPTQIAS